MYPRLQLSQSISTNSALITFFLIKPPETKPYMEGPMRLDKRETGNDEGMENMEGVVYQVFSWTYMPTPDTNGGDK